MTTIMSRRRLQRRICSSPPRFGSFNCKLRSTSKILLGCGGQFRQLVHPPSKTHSFERRRGRTTRQVDRRRSVGITTSDGDSPQRRCLFVNTRLHEAGTQSFPGRPNLIAIIYCTHNIQIQGFVKDNSRKNDAGRRLATFVAFAFALAFSCAL